MFWISHPWSNRGNLPPFQPKDTVEPILLRHFRGIPRPMNPSGIDFAVVVADLRRVENWLTQSLGVAVENPEKQNVRDPFAPPDDLTDLKDAIDRIRPLLWVFLSRRKELQNDNFCQSPAGVRSLMDDAITISDRYMRNND